MSLLEVNDVTVRFPTRDARGRPGVRTVVAGVSFALEEGERVGLVGESGSGKTTLGKALLALEHIAGGSVRFRGDDVHALRGDGLLGFRRGAQMIFQDPMGALNPRMTIGAALEEVLAVHHLAPRSERRDRVQALLDQVGLAPSYAVRYPHEFSGGQRQRVGIARALALAPALVVADEPVSALDVSVQAQILNLLKDIGESRRMACLLIAHDLAVVSYVCRRAMVMYQGRVVEAGLSAEVFGEPQHPYTQALRAAVPDPEAGPLVSPSEMPGSQLAAREGVDVCRGGCDFAVRCPRACDRCHQERPALRDVGGGRKVACHLV